MNVLLVLHVHRGLECSPEPLLHADLTQGLRLKGPSPSGISLITVLAGRHCSELHVQKERLLP